MWLLPAIAHISAVAARTYYRLSVEGDDVPRTGPVLLVANHPNSLLDPMLVATAARRPVRFLAKAPLFQDRKVGWLVRASGAIPVFRRVDDPTAMGKNSDMFRAVVTALTHDAAVGIFPEGISHSEPSITELKTGAARIALATALSGTLVRIAPVGIVLRRKDRFRSEASVLVGKPVEWSDLTTCNPEDRDAVRELTQRVSDALRSVTFNLDQWADQPLVQCTEAIWTAERGGRADVAGKVARLRVTTEMLSRFRSEASDPTASIAQAIVIHHQRLNGLGLTPSDLKINTGPRRNLLWAARRFYLVGVPALVMGVIGGVMFWIPFQVTSKLSQSANLPVDQRATFNLLVGIIVYGIWIAAVATIAARTTSITTGVIIGAILPIFGMIGLLIRERWRGAWRDVRRYFTFRSRRELIDALALRQRKLAGELSELYQNAV